jgi:predicted glycosyltransferase
MSQPLPPGVRGPAAKVMFYCHDTYGLGHLRRTLTLAADLRARVPSMTQLIVTGSPVAAHFPYPGGTDYIKLPSVVKTGAGQYEARSIATPFGGVRDMRSEILLSAARHFRPDVLIVDHAPAGLKGEAVATLRYLKESSPRTRLVVGLRDVIDEAPRVRRAWAEEGVYEFLDDVYDLILVYGHRHLYDPVAEYGFSPCAAAKTRFVGYLGREPGSRSPAEVRAGLPLRTDRLVVVTAGGGGDGQELFRAVLAGQRCRSAPLDYDCLLVGGPLMADGDRARLTELANGGTGIHFLDSTEEMTSYLGAADAVVSMGGYNSVCEILSLGRPALIVPRVTPRKEQLIRAEALSRLGLVRTIHPKDLSPRRLSDEVAGLLAEPANRRPRLRMDGLQGVAEALRPVLPRPLAAAFEPPRAVASPPAVDSTHAYGLFLDAPAVALS